jgi:hypothetical protein
MPVASGSDRLPSRRGCRVRAACSGPLTSAPARRCPCLTATPVLRLTKGTGEMADLVFVVLTVAVFVLLGLVVKAVGRL